MAFKVNDKICWVHDLADPDTLRFGTITRASEGKEPLVWVDFHHKPEDCLYAAYAWPFSAKDELIKVVTERQRLKKAYDDSIGLIYELRNRVTRGEFK